MITHIFMILLLGSIWIFSPATTQGPTDGSTLASPKNEATTESTFEWKMSTVSAPAEVTDMQLDNKGIRQRKEKKT